VDAVALPLFMGLTVPVEKPGYDPAAIQVGTKVFVLDRVSWKRTETYEGEVTSKARVWITVTRTPPAGYPREWRLRLDDQTDGSGRNSNYGTSFRTPSQHRYHLAYDAAWKYLADQGIRMDHKSPWNGRTIELARIIWTAEHRELLTRAIMREEHGHPYTAAGRAAEDG
jgi:hypothetical protein